MTVARCLSSQLMTELLSWKNSGPAVEWRDKIQYSNWKFSGKFLPTEIGLLLVAITSLVESVVYAVFTVLSLALYPFTTKPCTFFVKLLQSSSFTVIWSVAEGVYYNCVYSNSEPDEPFARAHMYRWDFLRDEDKLYIENIKKLKELANYPIAQGILFIRNNILSNASSATKKKFAGMDHEIMEYVSAKAIFIYAMGSERKAVLPDFFNQTYKDIIEEFRKSNMTSSVKKTIMRCLDQPESFKTGLDSHVFMRLKAAAQKVQVYPDNNCLLIGQCWPTVAIELSSQ